MSGISAHNRFLKALLVASTALAPLGLAGVAQAQQAAQASAVAFDMPAQPLTPALTDFARRTGLRLAYPASLTAGKSAPALRGSYTHAEALSRLLAGSGLSYRFTGAGAVTITDRVSASHESVAADGSLVLDTIEVRGGQGGNPADAPYETAGSSSYISQEQIERFRGTSPGDFLESSPGVLVGAKRTSGAVDVNVRGMQGMDRVPVTVDGAQQSNTLYRGYAGVASRSYIDPDFIGGVTVEKGPSLASDGAGATGGVVRMSTIDAEDILLDDRNFGVRVRGGFQGNTSTPPAFGTRGGIDGLLANGQTIYAPGTLPDSFNFTDGLDRPSFLEPTSGYGSVAAAGRNENFEFVAAVARRKLGNYHAGENGDDAGHVVLTPVEGGTRAKLGGLTHFQAGEEVLNTSNDSTSYLLKGVFKADNGHRLELGYTKYMSTYYEMFPSQVMWFGGPFQEAPSTVDLDTYTATYTWKPDDNDLIDLKANLWRTDVGFEIGQSAKTILPEYPFMTFYTNVDAVRWGANLTNTSRFQTTVGDVRLDYGISYTDEDMTQLRTMDALPPYIPEPTSEPGKSGTRQEWSAYASAEWKPLDWLTLDGGLRYTATETHDRCLYPNGDTCKDTSNDGFAPLVTATVEPWTGIQFYSRYAEAIRSPSLYEATRGESFTVSPIFDLVPEHARNWEFGMNVLRDDVLVSGDSLRFKAAYFDNDIEDYLTRTYTATGESGTFTLRNLDRARFKGIELSASYDTGRFFAEAGYTRYLKTAFCLTPEDAAALEERVCNEGGVNAGYAQLHLPPEQTASLTLGTRLFEEKLTVGGRVTYVGERPVKGIADDTNGWTTLTDWNPYTLVDVFATWKINDHMEAEFNVDNLTDVYYVDALAMGLVPAPGRTFRAVLTAKF